MLYTILAIARVFVRVYSVYFRSRKYFAKSFMSSPLHSPKHGLESKKNLSHNTGSILVFLSKREKKKLLIAKHLRYAV